MATSFYGLYHTLNKNLPSEKVKETQKTKLIKKVSRLGSEEKEALIMLIYEHAKVKGDIENKGLPYEGKQKGMDVEFDLQKLPSDLFWILSKFLEVISPKTV